MKMSARCTKDGPIKRTETYFQNCSFIRSLPKWIDEPLALVSVHDGLESLTHASLKIVLNKRRNNEENSWRRNEGGRYRLDLCFL